MSEDYFILIFVDDELRLLIRALYLLSIQTKNQDLIDSCFILVDRLQSKLGGN